MRAATGHGAGASKPTGTTGESGCWRDTLKQGAFGYLHPVGVSAASVFAGRTENMCMYQKSQVSNAITEQKGSFSLQIRKHRHASVLID